MSKTSILLLLASPAWAIEGFVIGGGVESDSDEGLAAAFIVDVGLTEKTWLSGSAGKTFVDLPSGRQLDPVSGGIGIDHFFDPLGVRFEVAYWGDDSVLDSTDLRGSLYWRNDKVSVSGDYEFRDFDFIIPRGDLSPPREIPFDAKGVGASARIQLSDVVSFNISGIDYDYSVDVNLQDNPGILELVSVSRLSLINSLIDYRAGAGLSFDIGARSLALDYRIWESAVDGTRTNSTTLRFLAPMGASSDVELGLGVDDSDRYGSVTFFSLFVYFYGGV